MDYAALATNHPLDILLAEDNEVNQMLMVRILKRFGYETAVAANGRETLKLLEQHSFDLILMDIQMPEMGGVECTAIIRQKYPPEQQPRIFALTAENTIADSTQIQKNKFDGLLVKPISIGALTQVLEDTSNNKKKITGVTPVIDLIDFTVLDEFKLVMGEEGDEAIKELAALYLEHAPKLLASINSGLAAGNLELVRANIHSLKGNSAQLGVVSIAALCRKIEELLKEGDTSTLRTVFQSIESNFALVRVEFEKII
jgi:CheY-like chemotaxis protein